MVVRQLALLRQRVGGAATSYPHELLQQLLWAAAPLQQPAAVPTASGRGQRCHAAVSWRQLATAAAADAAHEPPASHKHQMEQQHQQQASVTFEEMGVPAAMTARLAAMNITTPTPVQEQAMPAVLSGRNVAIQNPTGSGKTLAYLLPLLTRTAGWQWRRPWKSDHPHVRTTGSFPCCATH